MLCLLNQLLNSIWVILNTNIISSIFGGLIVALIFWKFFESKVNAILEYNEKKKISQKFIEELLYNRFIANKIVEKEAFYLANNDFTSLTYESESINNFVTTEPLDLNKQIYLNIRVVNLVAFKKDNMLLKIYWFAPEQSETGRKVTKKAIIGNAKLNIENIDKILNNAQLLKELKKYGITDPAQATSPQ